jgi:putative oxidoreductase
MKNSFLFRTTALNTDLATLLIRFIIGGMFIYHGYLKIDNYSTYMPMMQDIIGIGAKLSYDLVIVAEFGCGILVVLGFLTRLSIIPIFISMIIAYFIAHEKDAFMMKMLPFVYMLLCIPIFLLGSGKYSVDRLIFKK